MAVRSYSKAFKANAVARVLAGETQTAVAADVGTAAVNVQRWVREATGSVSVEELTPRQQLVFLQQEAAYRRDLDRLAAEIDLLKKVLSSGGSMPSPDPGA